MKIAILTALVTVSVISTASTSMANPKPACSGLANLPIDRITPSTYPMSGSTVIREARNNSAACMVTNDVKTPGHLLTYTVPGNQKIVVQASNTGVISMCAHWDSTANQFLYSNYTTEVFGGKPYDCGGRFPH